MTRLNFRNDPNIDRRIPVLSFFTGAGLLDIGFLKAGFDIIWHNENNLDFVEGFEFGMGSLQYTGHNCLVQNTNSIIDIGPQQIVKEAFNNLAIPDVFGIIGGPPCPDFSVGGKNRGKEGDKGFLSKVFINRIIELQPTFFLFENVPGLLHTKKHKKFLSELMAFLSSDFNIEINIINSLDFGVPQDRERVFLIGFNKKWLRRNTDLTIHPQWNNWIPMLEAIRKKHKARLNNSTCHFFVHGSRV